MAANEIESWKKQAILTQQSLFLLFGDREWDKTERNDLKRKLAFAMCGPPSTESEIYLGYTKQLYDSFIKVTEYILSYFEKFDTTYIYLSYVYILIKTTSNNQQGTVPVIRLAKDNNPKSGIHLFIECDTLRVYTTFGDFLKNNKLPACHMCFPTNGVYSHKANYKVLVSFTRSPACDITWKIADASVMAGNIATSAVCIASVFMPIIAPVVYGSVAAVAGTSIYSGARHVYHLVDIDKHNGHIGLRNSEARNHWLGLATSTVSGVAVGGAAILPRVLAGKSLGQLTTIGIEVLNYSSIAVNAVSIVSCFIDLVEKFRCGTLETKDILKLISVCFFIANIAISATLAEKLISEFSSHSNNTTLFNMVNNSTFSSVKSVVCYTQLSSFSAVRELIFGSIKSSIFRPLNFNYLPLFVEKMASNYVMTFVNKERTPIEFVMITMGTLTHVFPNFQPITNMIEQAHEIYSVQNWRDIKVNDEQIFQKSSIEVLKQVSSQYERLDDNLTTIDDKLYKLEIHKLVRDVVNKLAQQLQCKTDFMYVRLASFVCNRIIDKYNSKLIYNCTDQQPQSADQIQSQRAQSKIIDPLAILTKILFKMKTEKHVTKLATDFKTCFPAIDLDQRSEEFIPFLAMDENKAEFYYLEKNVNKKATSEFYHNVAHKLLKRDINYLTGSLMISYENITVVISPDINGQQKMVLFHSCGESRYLSGIIAVISV